MSMESKELMGFIEIATKPRDEYICLLKEIGYKTMIENEQLKKCIDERSGEVKRLMDLCKEYHCDAHKQQNKIDRLEKQLEKYQKQRKSK